MTKKQLEELLNSNEELQNLIASLISEVTDPEEDMWNYTVKVSKVKE